MLNFGKKFIFRDSGYKRGALPLKLTSRKQKCHYNMEVFVQVGNCKPNKQVSHTLVHYFMLV